MRAPMLTAVFVLYSFAVPVAVQAEQAKGVPQVGVLTPTVPQSDLVGAILPTDHIVGLARLKDFLGK